MSDVQSTSTGILLNLGEMSDVPSTGIPSFDDWPDLVQLQLFKYLWVQDCLNLRLVSKGWARGVEYVWEVWNICRPCFTLDKNIPLELYTYTNELQFQSLNRFTIQNFPDSLKDLAGSRTSKLRLPEFECFEIGESNIVSNVSFMLSNYLSMIKKLTLKSFCMSGIDLTGQSFKLPFLEELEIDMYAVPRSWKPYDYYKDHMVNLTAFLDTMVLPKLIKLSLRLGVSPRHDPGQNQDTSPQFLKNFRMAFEDFLIRYGSQINELELYLDQFYLDVFAELKHICGIKKFSLILDGRCPQLIRRWTKGIKQFNNIRDLYISVGLFNTFIEEVMETILKECNTYRMEQAHLVGFFMNLDSLYFNPLPEHLKYLNLQIYDSVFVNFEKMVSGMPSLSKIVLKLTVLENDSGKWRKIFVKWLCTLAPNLEYLKAQFYSNAPEQYKLETEHVGELFDKLPSLWRLNVKYRLDGVPEQTDLEQFCAESDGIYRWRVFKQVINPDEDFADFDDIGFEIIKLT